MSKNILKTSVSSLKNNSLLYNNELADTNFKFIPLVCEYNFDPSLEPVDLLNSSGYMAFSRRDGYLFTISDNWNYSVTLSIRAGDTMFYYFTRSDGIFISSGVYNTPNPSLTITFPTGSTKRHITFDTIGNGDVMLPPGVEWAVLGQNVTSISTNADGNDFSSVSPPKRIHCTNSLTTIKHGGLTDAGVTGLSLITIPASVTTIEDYALSYTGGYPGINLLPDNYVTFGKNPFLWAGVLKDKIGNNWEIYNNILYRGLDKIDLIGAGFLYPRKFELPDSVLYIGDYALENQQNFNGPLILPPNLQTIGNYGISSRYLTGELRIPASITSLGVNAINQCTGLTILNIAPGYNPIANSTNYVFNCSNNFTADSLNQSIINIASGTKTVTIGATNKARLLAAYPQAQVNANARGITIV